MRPVVKKPKFIGIGAPLEVNPWGNAKQDLVNELGSYCSFCEKYNSRSALHVEHMYGKGCKDQAGNLIYNNLKFRWDNFLLACVNCNGVKGNKDIAALNPFMPHEDNLLYFLEVINGGLIQIKRGTTGNDLDRTQAFVDLIGLDRVPNHPQYSNKDDRWDNRLTVFDKATRQRAKYTNANPTTDLETIVDVARTSGHFSVWYYIFAGVDDVLDALINGITIAGTHVVPFPGIHAPSFDPANHFATLPRP
jgi:hypothetical protein